MTRTEVAVVALIVLVVAWLLMPPPVAPDSLPPAIDPCPQMWTPERGVYGGCTVFLPLVEKCSECLSAWPVWPDSSVVERRNAPKGER